MRGRVVNKREMRYREGCGYCVQLIVACTNPLTKG